MDIWSLIIGATISAVVSMIIVPLFQDVIIDLMVNMFGGWLPFRTSQNISGWWSQEWYIDDYQGKQPANENKTAIVRQLGSRVVAKFHSNRREYRLRGKLEKNGFINGTWFDKETGSTYTGAFQLRVEINAERMTGKWIGFSGYDINIIRSGSWVWLPLKS